MTRERRNPGSPARATSTTPIADLEFTAPSGQFARASQQVSWSDVHTFVLPKLRAVGDWPLLGSPAWCALDDRDRVKWASVLDAGQHWALRLECLQQASCDASREVSAAVDWSQVSRSMERRNAFLVARGEPIEYFTPRPWLDRRNVQ